tara:strand:- start:87 stop:440 length:354 start_codon:yes stop_codon:yes gene_type:complete
MSYLDEASINETSLQELRARIFDRKRSPHAGRFDPASHVEQGFVDRCRLAVAIAEELAKRSLNDIDKHYFLALADEIEDTERFVRDKWKAQDNAIAWARENPKAKPSELPPGQATLF